MTCDFAAKNILDSYNMAMQQ